MQLHDLSPAPGSRKNRKRVGRGPGSGMGKTSTRGHKGLKARAGGSVRPGFEGGQMPLYRRLPKRGFKNPFKSINAILNLRDLNAFDEGAVIDAEALKKAGMIKGRFDQIKILGKGDLNRKLSFKNILVSSSARQQIEALGGTVE